VHNGKGVVGHVDDKPYGLFVNYVLVVEEGHVGGMLGVDKQVVRSRSTIVATNTRANQVPPFQGMHYVIIVWGSTTCYDYRCFWLHHTMIACIKVVKNMSSNWLKP
jgi:hypothetical protein